MKKELSIILLVLLTINLISAIEIQLSKDHYQPQETLQAEITGNFIDPLTIENIFLYKEGIPRTMPAISDLTKFQDTYYLYMLLPNQESNFSIKIENIKYTQAGTEKTEPIIKEFKIQRTNQSALQINQGFIKTTKDFSIKIKSLYENQDISAEFETQTHAFSLNEDFEKTISFSITGIEPGKTNLKINDYNIPVFIIKKTEQETDNKTIANQTQTNITNQSEEKINITNLTQEEIEALNCEDIGEKCDDNEKCDGETKPSLDGSCCIGECKEKKQTSYTWIIGIILIIIVLAVISFFYFKSKKKLKLKKHKEILEEKTEKFEDRMRGESEEVNKSLSRI